MNEEMEKFLNELKEINSNTAHIDIQLEEVTNIRKELENIGTLLTDIRDYLKDIHYYKTPESQNIPTTLIPDLQDRKGIKMKLPYLKCKQCSNRIYTRDVKTEGKSKILTCPYCLGQNKVILKKIGFNNFEIEIVGLREEVQL